MQATTHYRTLTAPKLRRDVAGKTPDVPPRPLELGTSKTPVEQAATPACEAVRDLGDVATPRLSPVATPAVETVSRPIDPMLLVHQERMETFRIVVQFVRRVMRAVAARHTILGKGD